MEEVSHSESRTVTEPRIRFTWFTLCQRNLVDGRGFEPPASWLRIWEMTKLARDLMEDKWRTSSHLGLIIGRCRLLLPSRLGSANDQDSEERADNVI
jgi:hypothetical protein